MKCTAGFTRRAIPCVLLTIAWLGATSFGQNSPASERTFSKSKASIEQLLKQLQPSMAGRLPVLEGFVNAGDQPLERYRRAFYQTTAQVSTGPSKNSIVRVTTKITAWYTDPAGTHSGYRVLPSNGRLESDLLDELSEGLNPSALAPSSQSPVTERPPSEIPTTMAEPERTKSIASSAPVSGPFAAPLTPVLPGRDEIAKLTKPVDSNMMEEIKSLEEVLRNQAHPNNLVIVKQSGTSVVASPSLTAKTLFLATAHDEFEMLDFNADWVHVRISGLSRGWIWRNSVEMPDGIPETATRLDAGPRAAAEQLFHVTREETAAFPGDWEPLKGKSVKIVSIEKVNEAATDSGIIMRLEFAKAQIDKYYQDLAKSGTLAGIVLIFDSADGGMIAATLPVMQQWKAGTLSDSAFWHQCFFDPPELNGATSPSGSR